MSDWGSLPKRFLGAEDGATAVEYAVMLLLVLLACIGGIAFFGSTTAATLTRNGQAIQQATGS